MAIQGDTKRAQSIKAEFDSGFCATALGGACLLERAMRRLGLREMLDRLPKRSEGCTYSMSDACNALIVSLVLGGKGLKSAQMFRDDLLLADVFGLRGEAAGRL